MKVFAIPSVVLLLLALFAASCSSVQTRRNPSADLSRLQRFYVEHRLSDDHHVDDTIVAELHALGRTASSGPLTMLPPDTQAIVSYEDDWAWDFKSYLIQLNLAVRDAHNDQGLATGTYRQPSMITKPTAEVVRAILLPLLKRR